MHVYKARYPINVYVLLISISIELFCLINEPWGKVLFYFILTFFTLYAAFSRYACKIEVSDSIICIKYFFFGIKLYDLK